MSELSRRDLTGERPQRFLRTPRVVVALAGVLALGVVLRERHLILLTVGSPGLRAGAVRGGLGEGRRVGAILRLALADPSLEVRLAAMSGLIDRELLDRKRLPAPGSRAREEVIRRLAESLDSRDSAERERAAEALRRIGLGKQRTVIVPRLVASLVAELQGQAFQLRESAALMLLSDQGPRAGEELLAASALTGERGAFAIGVLLVSGWPRSLVERCSRALESGLIGEEVAALSFFLKWTGATRTPLLSLPEPHRGRLLRSVTKNLGSASAIKRRMAEQLARMLNLPPGGGQ